MSVCLSKMELYLCYFRSNTGVLPTVTKINRTMGQSNFILLIPFIHNHIALNMETINSVSLYEQKIKLSFITTPRIKIRKIIDRKKNCKKRYHSPILSFAE